MTQARIKTVFSTLLMAGFLLFALTASAWAQFEDVITRVDNTTIDMPELIELISFILGLFALYAGVVALKETSQEPGKKPLRPALIRFGIAAMLLALPRTIVLITESAGGSTTSMPAMARPRLMSGTGLN